MATPTWRGLKAFALFSAMVAAAAVWPGAPAPTPAAEAAPALDHLYVCNEQGQWAPGSGFLCWQWTSGGVSVQPGEIGSLSYDCASHPGAGVNPVIVRRSFQGEESRFDILGDYTEEGGRIAVMVVKNVGAGFGVGWMHGTCRSGLLQ